MKAVPFIGSTGHGGGKSSGLYAWERTWEKKCQNKDKMNTNCDAWSQPASQINCARLCCAVFSLSGLLHYYIMEGKCSPFGSSQPFFKGTLTVVEIVNWQLSNCKSCFWSIVGWGLYLIQLPWGITFAQLACLPNLSRKRAAAISRTLHKQLHRCHTKLDTVLSKYRSLCNGWSTLWDNQRVHVDGEKGSTV